MRGQVDGPTDRRRYACTQTPRTTGTSHLEQAQAVFSTASAWAFIEIGVEADGGRRESFTRVRVRAGSNAYTGLHLKSAPNLRVLEFSATNTRGTMRSLSRKQERKTTSWGSNRRLVRQPQFEKRLYCARMGRTGAAGCEECGLASLSLHLEKSLALLPRRWLRFLRYFLR
eukprot:1205974-Pleurochrysis_carterae.AAC.3